MNTKLWTIATLGMIAAAVVIWSQVMRDNRCPPDPMPPAAEQPTFPAIRITCDRDHVEAMVSVHGRNRIVCQRVGGAK